MELVRSLTDSEDEVRLAAGLATEALAGNQLLGGKRDMLLVLALLLLHDPIERVRLAAVTVLDRLSRESGACATAASESLAVVLCDPSAEVRELTVGTLVRIGRRMIPQLTEQLNAAEPLAQKMTAVVLARIEPNKYRSLILGNFLERNLKVIYQNISCRNALSNCSSPPSSMLGRALFEQNSALLDEFFYLLSAVRNPASVDSIAISLRSHLLEERATALEALETFTDPKMAGLVAPLLDPEQALDLQLSLARFTWGISCPTPAAALRQLLNRASDGWQRTLAAAALPELNTSAVPVPEVEIAELLELVRVDPDPNVRSEASRAAAQWKSVCAAMKSERVVQPTVELSVVEKLILIKNITFFEAMTIDQLRILAKACEQEFYPAGAQLYKVGDPGGMLYVVVIGRVGIEYPKYRGSYALLATIEAHGYFGESDLFDGNKRSTSAIAICDTLILRLRREPLIALARQNPDLSLELIKALSSRLREATLHIAELTKTHPQILHKLYDQLSESL
jgi:CRP-like cAMP-binding protein